MFRRPLHLIDHDELAHRLRTLELQPEPFIERSEGSEDRRRRRDVELSACHPTSVLTPPRNIADVRLGQRPSCGMWSQRNEPNVVIVGGDVPLDIPSQTAEGVRGRRGQNRTVAPA
jgi:hypothetical protein